MTVSRDLIAWAAGLYDGEGSASMYVPRARKTARRQMQVSQAGTVGHPPDVLIRFQAAVGAGSVTGPYRGYLFYWKTTKIDAIDAVTTRLWPYLSDQKRVQYARVTIAAGRVPAVSLQEARRQDAERAWAAGFFDGEGSIWVGGPQQGRSRRIAMELSQAGAAGMPESLARFAAVVGVGSVSGPYPPRSPWSRLPQYRWGTSGRHNVSTVLALLWPWLSGAKRARALEDRELFDAGLTMHGSEPSI